MLNTLQIFSHVYSTSLSLSFITLVIFLFWLIYMPLKFSLFQATYEMLLFMLGFKIFILPVATCMKLLRSVVRYEPLMKQVEDKKDLKKPAQVKSLSLREDLICLNIPIKKSSHKEVNDASELILLATRELLFNVSNWFLTSLLGERHKSKNFLDFRKQTGFSQKIIVLQRRGRCELLAADGVWSHHMSGQGINTPFATSILP